MGVYREVDPATGQVREFNIAGDTPTVDERVQINQAFRPDQAPSPILPFFDSPAPAAPAPASESAPAPTVGSGDLEALSQFNRLMEARLARTPAQTTQQYGTAATAFGRGMGLDPLQRRLSMLTSRRVIAEQMGDTEAAARLREEEDAAMQEIQAFIEANPMQDFYGIEGIGDFGSFAGEALGQQASDLAIQTGATAAGAGIGALFGGVGAAPGAAIGRGLGVAYTTVRMLPQLFAENIRAQEEEGADDVSLSKALATTVGQAMAEFAADYITLVPGSGEVASAAMRAVRQGGEAAILQGGTEAVQQAMTRFQAGQPLDDEEALKDLFEAFAAGAVIGAPIGAGVGAVSAPTARSQLEEDARKALGERDVSAAFAAQAESPTQPQAAGDIGGAPLQIAQQEDIGDAIQIGPQQPTEEAQNSVSLSDLTPSERRSIEEARDRRKVPPTLRRDSASLSEIQATLGTSVVNRIVGDQKSKFAPIVDKPFTEEQFNAVQAAATAQGKVNSQLIRDTIGKMTGQPVSRDTQKAIIQEFQNRNLAKQKARETGGRTRYEYDVNPQLLSSNTANVQAQKESLQLQQDIDQRNQELEQLRADERRLRQTGRTMDGTQPSKVKKAQMVSQMARRMNEIELENRASQARIQKINEQAGTLEDTAGPTRERLDLGPTQRVVERGSIQPEVNREAEAARAASAFDQEIVNLKKTLSARRKEQLALMQQGQQANPRIDTEITALQDQISETQTQREIARSAALRGETPTKSTFSPVYSEKFQKIADNLRFRLNKLGLKDVDLSIEGLIDGDTAVQGQFNPKRRGTQRVIRLASAIYDQNLTDAQLEARLAEIMDHELIHALWNMGVFSDAELTSLRKAAAERNFIEMVDGKPVKRKYTYLQRAQYFYSNRSPEVQMEEAIAEMFRNYAAGRDSMAGRPRSVFKRIMDVFKSIFRANKQENIASPRDIFASIEGGEIGARDRATIAGDDTTRDSRVIPPDIKIAMRGPVRDPRGDTFSGVVERYTVENNSQDAPTTALIAGKTTAANADNQSQALDLLLKEHPEALNSVENWVGIANDAFGQSRVPMPPFRTIQIVQAGPEAIEQEIGNMSEGMVRDANEGLAMAQRLGGAYRSGQVTPQTTARLFLWSFLSRGVSPYVQESAFLDAVAGPKSAGIDSIIERGIRDGWDDVLQAEYDAWARDAIPEGSPGKGTTHNLNAFGRNFLRVMLQRHPDAGDRTGLQIIHDMVSDGTPSYLIRREFLKRGEGAGIDNKVVSFTLLLMGRDDVLVLDRVQVRNQFDDGRFAGENIYDADIQDGKQVTGTAVANLTFGHKGLLYYETMERALKPLVEAAYQNVGREGNLGRYHWDSWVLASNQEVGHSSVEGLSREANGDSKGFVGTFVRQGKYNAYDYGFKYTVMPDGQMAVVVDTFNDGPYIVPRENLGSDSPLGKGMNRLKTLARRAGPEFGESRPWVSGLNEAQKEQYDETIRSNGTLAPDVGEYTTDAVGREIDGSGVRDSRISPEEKSGSRFSQRVASSFEQQADRLTSGTSPDVAIQRQMTQYTDFADTVAKALGYFTKDKKKAEERAYRFVRKMQDSFVEVGKMIKELKAQGLEITDVIDPYLKDQLSRSAAGAKIERRKRTIHRRLLTSIGRLNVNDSMKESLIQASRRNAADGTQGLAHHVFENSKSVREGFAEIYLYALHAKERNAYIRDKLNGGESGSGMSDAEATDILNWFAENMRGENRDTLTAIQLATQAIVKDTNTTRAEAGLISRDLAEDDRNFENYIPMKGVFDDDDTDSYGAAPSGRRMGGPEDRRLTGRADAAYGRDLVANLLFQNANAVVRAERNGVNDSLLRLFEEAPELMKAYGEVLTSPPMKVQNINGSLVMRPENIDYRRDPSIVIVKRDGKEIPIRMYSTGISGAFNGMNMFNVGHANSLIRGLSKVNRIMSSLITSYNPEFIFSNFPRDLQTAGVNISEFDMDGLTKDVIGPGKIKEAFKALKRATFNETYDGEWGATYQEFVEAGGASAANPMANLDDQLREIDRTMAEFRGEGKIIQKARKLGDLVEGANSIFENAVRLTTYKALRDRGYSAERAAQAARSVTVDFTKTGDLGQFLNSLYLFYNASLQGSFFLFRAAARSKKVQGLLLGTIGMGIMMDILNREILSEDDESGVSEYDKIPDYILERNWVFMLPSGMGSEDGNRYIAIPMPYGLHAFYNAGRAMTNMLMDGGYDVSDAGASIGRNLMDVVNPFGGTETFLNAVAPTVFDPIINLTANVDFTGRPIRKEAFPGQDASAASLYWNSTSPTAVSIARILNEATGGTETISGWADVSPNDIEFMFDFITGGAGRFVQRTVEAPLMLASGQPLDEIVREIPLARKIFGAVSSREDTSAYIEGRDRVNLARSELRSAMNQGDQERAAEARQRFAAELQIVGRIRAIESARRAITERINTIQENDRMPPERKQQLIDQLDERRQLLIARGLQTLREAGLL